MIGLDAASLPFIEASLSSLPNLRRLLETGAPHRFRSRSSDLFPASVWPTFYTGTQPDHHGVYYPLQWDAASMSLKPAIDLLYCEPFWHDLERRGYRVIAVDVPCTWRSRLERGIEITDWATHEAVQGFAVHPPELEQEIRKQVGGRQLGPEIPVKKSLGQLKSLRDETLASVVRKSALVTWLLKQQAWDFFITVFGETHRAGHLFWPGQHQDEDATGVPADALLDCYADVDRALGDVLHVALDGQTSIVVFSVHGMGSNRSQDHFTRPIMDRVNARFASELGENGGARPPHSLMLTLRERLPARIQHAIGRAVSHRVKDAVVNRAITGGYDWDRTPGLAILSSLPGFIRFNLRGREAHGLLEPGSALQRRYEQCITDTFHAWRYADTGQPLTREVVFTSEACSGARRDCLPDAVVLWEEHDSTTRIESEAFGAIDGPPLTGRGGNHMAEAFAVVLDPVGVGTMPAPRAIVDLAPMALQMLTRATPSISPRAALIGST